MRSGLPITCGLILSKWELKSSSSVPACLSVLVQCQISHSMCLKSRGPILRLCFLCPAQCFKIPPTKWCWAPQRSSISISVSNKSVCCINECSCKGRKVCLNLKFSTESLNEAPNTDGVWRHKPDAHPSQNVQIQSYCTVQLHRPESVH